MLVSIIVPTYNRSKLLIKTIDSIFNQSYDNFELIVVSDGSNDDTKEKLSQIKDKRLNFIQLKKNYGYPAKARNEGIKNSNGSLIAFCDDDDLWEKDKLKRQIKIYNDGYNFIFTNYNIIDNRKKYLRKVYSEKIVTFIINKLNKSFSYLFLSFTNPIANSSVLISKNLLINSHFEESVSFRAVEDYQLWIKIYIKSKPYYINDNLINYRIHESNISSDLKKNLIKCLLVIKNMQTHDLRQIIFKIVGILFYSFKF